MQHIPYKGSGPALTDLIGGQVQLAFNVPITVIPHVKSGRLKAIAVTGDSRLQPLPHVPTYAEAGLPGYDLKGWYGILGPAGMPREIVDKLSTELARILANPEFKEQFVSQSGMDPFFSTPDQFTAMMNAETAKYTKIIRAGNIKLEQ